LAALPDLLECLKNRGAQEIIVIAGGIIPSEDIETLEKLGVKKVFPEGSHTYKIVDFIKKEIPLDPRSQSIRREDDKQKCPSAY